MASLVAADKGAVLSAEEQMEKELEAQIEAELAAQMEKELEVTPKEDSGDAADLQEVPARRAAAEQSAEESAEEFVGRAPTGGASDEEFVGRASTGGETKSASQLKLEESERLLAAQRAENAKAEARLAAVKKDANVWLDSQREHADQVKKRDDATLVFANATSEVAKCSAEYRKLLMQHGTTKAKEVQDAQKAMARAQQKFDEAQAALTTAEDAYAPNTDNSDY